MAWAERFGDLSSMWAEELAGIEPEACSESLAVVVLEVSSGDWSLVLVVTLVHTEAAVWFDELIEDVVLV